MHWPFTWFQMVISTLAANVLALISELELVPRNHDAEGLPYNKVGEFLSREVGHHGRNCDR